MKTALVYRCILELSTFEYDCLVGLHIKVGKRKRRGGGITNEQTLSDKLHYLAVVIKFKFFSGPAKNFVLKSRKKMCYILFCEIQFNAVYPNPLGKEQLFCAEVKSLLSKFLFTHLFFLLKP